MFMAILCIIVQKWKTPNVHSREWLDTSWYIQWNITWQLKEMMKYGYILHTDEP